MTGPRRPPPYRVPTMDEIRALPWNGYNVVSTFSGCGGSSTGYRMAGFRVLWASEFVDAARASYLANAAPYTVVDGRDIRTVTAAELLSAAGLGVGEIDLFDGSPPCAAFSTAGKREAGWGLVKQYSDREQRTDDLFYEFARLIEGCQPRVFVAENVSGLVKGTAKGYFIRIMERLRACGYQVAAKLLDAQWLGVPQARQRLIFVGVRNDLAIGPVFPRPLPHRYSTGDALASFGTAVRLVTTTSYAEARPREFEGCRPAPTVTALGISAKRSTGEVAIETTAALAHDPETGTDLSIAGTPIGREWSLVRPIRSAAPTVARKLSIAELRRLCGFPDDFVLSGTYEQRWERLGRAVPPVMMAAVAAVVRDRILTPATGAPA